MIKAIIFDFGGVLYTDINFEQFWIDNADKLSTTPEEAHAHQIELWLLARVGAIDSWIYWEEMGKKLNITVEEARKPFMQSSFFHDNVIEYINTNLKGKYKLGLLSNHIQSWLDPLMEEKHLSDIFDVLITSYGVKMAKPDPEIYIHTAKALAVECSECIYIDDTDRNLPPAQELGMKTIDFKHFEQFKTDLENLLK